MNDPVTVPATPTASEPVAPAKAGFAFTDPGCRTEIRLGALMVLVGVFMWGWIGPTYASPLAYLGVPLVLIGVPLQIRDARRIGRPGYPWKLGIALGVGAALMSFDLAYRERFDAPMQIPLTTILLMIPGAWILVGWPFARSAASAERAA